MIVIVFIIAIITSIITISQVLLELDSEAS